MRATLREPFLERAMPANSEAERLILGAVLLDNQHLDLLAAVIRAEDFLNTSHQKIFAAMLAMHREDQAVDPVTLADWLAVDGDLMPIGGPAYIASLFDGIPRLSNIDSYVNIVRSKAQLRRAAHLSYQFSLRALDGDTSPEQLLAEMEQAVIELRQSGTLTGGTVQQTDVVDRLRERIRERCANPGGIPGLATGFYDLDDRIGGMLPGDVILLAGRPGTGKTSLAMNIKTNVARRGDRVVMVVSLEMAAEDLLERDVASQSGISYKAIRRGTLTPDEQRLVDITLDKELRAQSIEYFDTVNETTAATILAQCEAMQRRRGRLDLLIVDHIHLMDGVGETQNAVITNISRGLKRVATKFRIPVLALAQLNRGVEHRGADARCRLSDLRDSGSLEQDAGTVLLINPIDPDNNEYEIDVAKNRFGETGPVMMNFFRERSRFTSAAKY